MDRKLLRNYLYNVLYQIVRFVMPFILVPYTLAHITADYLGIYNHAGSMMNIFILFGILGVNKYGNREIAKVRNDPEQLNRTFFEVLAMQIMNMIVATAAYFIFVRMTVNENRFFWNLTGLTMIASMLDVTWFFFGIEDFRRASIRNMIVKVLGVALIMTLCRTPQDLWLYIVINAGSELFGQLIMFIQLRNYVHFERISLREAYRKHFYPTLQLFIPTIAISVYTMLDQPMIGYLYNETHVTYYMSSMNLVKMFLYFITSIGTVMLPRVTNIYYNDEDGEQKAKNYIRTTMKIACLLSFPMCFGMMAIARNFISLYLHASPDAAPIIGNLVRMGCPVMIFISMSDVTGTQYMVPTGMYRQYSFSVIMGSLVNVMINLMLIPKYGAYGAIAGSIIAECTVTLLQLFLVRKRLEIGFLSKSYLVYALGSGLMYLLVVQLGRILPLSIPATLLQVGSGMIIYFAVLVLTREELCMSVLSSMRRRLSHA
ncbi:MAG: polysaccharide biosynthesis C-terminal domain-containing protein [Solobacterium sp.]|nr:polysaccharide biosynthesis C-terminal domain-containing protein [Solobacterium sp.]